MKGRHAELNSRSYHRRILQLPPLPLDFAASCAVIPLRSFSLLTSTLWLLVLRSLCHSFIHLATRHFALLRRARQRSRSMKMLGVEQQH